MGSESEKPIDSIDSFDYNSEGSHEQLSPDEIKLIQTGFEDKKNIVGINAIGDVMVMVEDKGITKDNFYLNAPAFLDVENGFLRVLGEKFAKFAYMAKNKKEWEGNAIKETFGDIVAFGHVVKEEVTSDPSILVNLITAPFSFVKAVVVNNTKYNIAESEGTILFDELTKIFKGNTIRYILRNANIIRISFGFLSEKGGGDAKINFFKVPRVKYARVFRTEKKFHYPREDYYTLVAQYFFEEINQYIKKGDKEIKGDFILKINKLAEYLRQNVIQRKKLNYSADVLTDYMCYPSHMTKKDFMKLFELTGKHAPTFELNDEIEVNCHEHKLKYLAADNYKWNCDTVKGIKCPRKTHTICNRYCCDKCKFDLCDDCVIQCYGDN